MTTRKPWTNNENADLVRLYFQMLDRATAGKPYNKAQLIRERQTGIIETAPRMIRSAWLKDRSRGSIEAKLMNASAAHRDLCPGAETMDGHGYRCLPNYQAALKEAMRRALLARGVEVAA